MVNIATALKDLTGARAKAITLSRIAFNKLPSDVADEIKTTITAKNWTLVLE